MKLFKSQPICPWLIHFRPKYNNIIIKYNSLRWSKEWKQRLYIKLLKIRTENFFFFLRTGMSTQQNSHDDEDVESHRYLHLQLYGVGVLSLLSKKRSEFFIKIYFNIFICRVNRNNSTVLCDTLLKNLYSPLVFNLMLRHSWNLSITQY